MDPLEPVESKIVEDEVAATPASNKKKTGAPSGKAKKDAAPVEEVKPPVAPKREPPPPPGITLYTANVKPEGSITTTAPACHEVRVRFSLLVDGKVKR